MAAVGELFAVFAISVFSTLISTSFRTTYSRFMSVFFYSKHSGVCNVYNTDKTVETTAMSYTNVNLAFESCNNTIRVIMYIFITVTVC